MKRLITGILTLALIGGGTLLALGASPLDKAKQKPSNTEGSTIDKTKHNLSTSGTGTVKAAKETEICIFCHTPHFASPGGPLWNRSLSSVQSYSLPSSQQSASLVSRPSNPPDGDSRLCLSCHDGTVALGAVLNRGKKGENIQMTGAPGGKMPPGASNLGTDLTGSHVVSVAVNDQLLRRKNSQGLSFRYQYPQDKKIKLRPTKNVNEGGAGKDGLGIQCTACHDPHDNSNTRFLVVPGRDDQWSSLCISCHGASTHGEGSHNDCSGCHKGHGEANTSMLKNKSEYLCFSCHDSGATSRTQSYKFTRRRTSRGEVILSSGNSDVQAAFNKAYRHPVVETGKFHKFGEELPEKNPATSRHVSCQDCHDQHRSNPDEPMVGVKGYSAARSKVIGKAKEYEICYKCHSDSANLPSRQKNKREQFSLNNPSYHPLEGPGRNRNVPSLIRPLDIQSVINCTDCHGNDDTYGARGPHGSMIQGLLVKNYTTTDMQGESTTIYALCYQCHDRNSILRNDSFKEHRRHLSEDKASCYTCHDSHGSQFYPHLISFDRRVVLPNSEGRLDYVSSVQDGRPTCYLKCHNKDHGVQEVKQKTGSPADINQFPRNRRR